jgi:excisionase family DNA binding protein
MTSRLLTATEVAHWLRVSRGWVFDHASGRRKPVLPSIKMGKAIRFRQEAVTAWIEALSNRAA